jgi:hypothetical protein
MRTDGEISKSDPIVMSAENEKQKLNRFRA